MTIAQLVLLFVEAIDRDATLVSDNTETRCQMRGECGNSAFADHSAHMLDRD
jgi:hypothetical protein